MAEDTSILNTERAIRSSLALVHSSGATLKSPRYSVSSSGESWDNDCLGRKTGLKPLPLGKNIEGKGRKWDNPGFLQREGKGLPALAAC